MNRDILFRGKRVDNNEWIISNCLMQIKEQNLRLWDQDDGWVEVIPETVGQFTGLIDKNCQKIFEGDIVQYGAKSRYDGIYKVVFETRGGSGYFGIVISEIETWGFCFSVPTKLMEVIGNIYDNHELLEIKQ